MTPEIIAWVLAIEPSVGDEGEDTLLRAIHAALTRQDFPDHHNQYFPFVDDAITHLLVRQLPSENGCFQIEPTEAGLLYWEMHGGKFSNFIHDCPPVPDLSLRVNDWQAEKQKLIEMIKLLRSDLWHQVEGKHGPEKASHYHSIVLADDLLANVSRQND